MNTDAWENVNSHTKCMLKRNSPGCQWIVDSATCISCILFFQFSTHLGHLSYRWQSALFSSWLARDLTLVIFGSLLSGSLMQGLPHCMYPGSYPGWYHGLHPGVYPVGRNDLIYLGRKLLWTVKFAGTLDGTLAGTMACTVLTSVKPGWQRHLWYQLILIRVIVWTHNQLLWWRCEPFLQTYLSLFSQARDGRSDSTIRMLTPILILCGDPCSLSEISAVGINIWYICVGGMFTVDTCQALPSGCKLGQRRMQMDHFPLASQTHNGGEWELLLYSWDEQMLWFEHTELRFVRSSPILRG